MIKRLIGFVVTMGVLAVVVLTFLHRDRFRTMLPVGDPAEETVTVQETLPVPVATASGETVAGVDSLSPAPEFPDSLRE